MEQLFIGAMFILALWIIFSRMRKLFNQDCGDCSGQCSCCQSPVVQLREIKLDKNIEK